MHLKGIVGSSVSKGLCGKVSEVASLKKFLQLETILRTLNTEFSSVIPAAGIAKHLKKEPPFSKSCVRPGYI